MPNIKKGRELQCPICGTWRYWSKSSIETYGRGKTCGKIECRSKSYSGKGNPFWGKKHSDETRAKIKKNRAKNLPKRTGPLPGTFKHTDEARKKISEASKRLWKEHRQKMLDSLPRGWNNAMSKPAGERRHRKHFTPLQRREWTSDKCAYCGSGEHLELDHIIPIFDEGGSDRENAQTLCRGCNLWKTKFVDLPRYHANLGRQGG
jgi:hypothetical protein